MLKKLFLIVLCISLALSVGCGKKEKSLSVDVGSEPSSVPEITEEVEEEEIIINPLTGLSDVTKEEAANRPVAIMVNNISVAQPVQTGLNKADVIYETEVEGGITRLMAVYQDIGNVEKIGTVRSSRYVYIDLAMGHNAIYTYHGTDPNYAKPHLKDTDAFYLDTNNGGTRISNGLATEHTLYAYGAKLWNSIKSSNRTLVNKNTAPWLNFAPNDQPVSYEKKANSISVSFSSYYNTQFEYDSATGRYIRHFRNEMRKDYYTGESVTVKNVFVLNAEMGHYPKQKYRKINLESGSGYYCVNGTYTPITWTKGASSNYFVFKNADGTELSVNPGNSWICIADSARSNPTFK